MADSVARAERLWADAEARSELERGQVIVGTTRNESTGGWVVWLSMYGTDLNLLSGWETRDQARVAWARYVEMWRNGELAKSEHAVIRLLEDDERSEGYLNPRPFSLDELAEIATEIELTIGARNG